MGRELRKRAQAQGSQQCSQCLMRTSQCLLRLDGVRLWGQASGWDSCGEHLEVNALSEVSRAELLEC